MALLSLPLDELRRRTSLKWRFYSEDVLPMWVAEMDTAMLPAAQEVVIDACRRGDTGYPFGTAYAEAFAEMASVRWQLELSPRSQIRRAGDVMNSIAAILEATTNAGDAVVINPPIYPPFRQVVSGYGREIVEVPLTAAGRLDLDGLAEAFAGPAAPRAYLLCSPHNPTGTIHTAAELTAVMELANAHSIQVISDEIHSRLVDPGEDYVPILSVPGGERAVVATSAGKAWNLAGFKAGLIIAGTQAREVLDALPPMAQQSSGHLANLAHTAALRYGQEWVDQLMVEVMDNKKLLASELAAKLPQVRYQPTPGTYLAWVDCSGLDLPDPVRHFREVGRVAFSPGSTFAGSHQQWARINLACAPEVVSEAVDRMAASVNDLE
ncbi:MAG: cystathionine beta-lyase [Actinobacteria bacterium HGW-Actinobacteria-2]|nr:MAG: cystathionine beta-lyase [Actinobacteria bacterium HGW-Actinobacteria-2]